MARAVTLALLIGTGYALHRQAPDAKTMKKNVADARNSLFEYLVGCRVWHWHGMGLSVVPDVVTRTAA